MSRFCIEMTQVGYEAATENTPEVRHCCGFFLCDTAADIPTQDEFSTDNIKLMIGSRSKVINEAADYMMMQNGTWVLQAPGEATYTRAEIDALIASVDTLKQGTEIPENSDLNDYTLAATYYSPNSTRTASLYNRPWTGSGFKLIVYSISSTNKMQMLMPMSSSAHSIFIRSRISSGWRDWYEIEGALISTINPYP